jgi:hypothetical protein
MPELEQISHLPVTQIVFALTDLMVERLAINS